MFSIIEIELPRGNIRVEKPLHGVKYAPSGIMAATTRLNYELNGLCRDCGRPAVPGKKRCAEHLYQQTRKFKERYQKDPDKIKQAVYKRRRLYLEQGRCLRCSTLLTEDEERYCVNCSSENNRKTMRRRS